MWTGADVPSPAAIHGVRTVAFRTHSAQGPTFAETANSPSLLDGGSTTIQNEGPPALFLLPGGSAGGTGYSGGSPAFSGRSGGAGEGLDGGTGYPRDEGRCPPS